MGKELEHELQNTILALANNFEKEAADRNAELIMDLHRRFEENEDLYECEISLAYMHFSSFAAQPWLSKHEIKDRKNKSIIEFMYNGLFTHYIRTVIERKEGSCCSGDKEGFIVRQVKKALITGENQSLHATYEGCERIDKSEWDKKAYWSPTSFKDTDEVIAAFWKWYRVEEEDKSESERG